MRALVSQLRLLVGAVLVFAAFEYGFHRWVMHSDRDAFADYQNLHVTHHTETQRDMTLDGGQGSDPRHIYFSLKTTAASVAICAAALGVLNGAFDLHFGATAAEATAHVGCVSVLVALWHTAHWQTIHGDIHEVVAAAWRHLWCLALMARMGGGGGGFGGRFFFARPRAMASPFSLPAQACNRRRRLLSAPPSLRRIRRRCPAAGVGVGSTTRILKTGCPV